MKTINFKSALFFAMTAMFTMTLSAQTADANSDANYDNGFRLGFGVSPGYVLREPYGFSLGGDVRLQYDFSKRYSVTLTSGYTHLFAKDEDVVGADVHDLGFIPVKAGFKAFWWEDQFYAMGEAGAGFAVTSEINKTTAILSPSIGWANDYLDISVRYDYFSDFPGVSNNEFRDGNHQIALRFAYGFRL